MKSENELAQISDTTLRDVLEVSPIGIAILERATGRRMFVNSALAKIFGAASTEEMLVQDISETWVNPDDLKRAMSVFQDSQTLVNFEAERKRRDGSRWWVLMNTQPMMFEGTEAGIVWHIDITDRKRAEDRLADAVESIADGFVLFDTEDRVAMWNRRFADMYPELAGMLSDQPTAEDMFRERHRVGAVGTFDIPTDEYVKWRMQMRRNQGGTPAVHRHRDGRWFRTTERSTTEGGIVAISTDVTELKVRELELTEALRQAELADSAKFEFLANFSHELRTPLNAINGFSEVLQLEMFGPLGHERYKEYAGDIRQSGDHLLALISDILDLSRIEAGHFEHVDEIFDVRQVVEDCVRFLRGKAQQKGVTIDLRMPETDLRLKADKRQLRQILLNLLSNAIKFTLPNTAVVVKGAIGDSGDMRFSVADSGLGIAAGNIERVQEPFVRLQSAMVSSEGGTGLGLAISKRLMESHGGSLQLSSEIGIGTNATASFPIERVVKPNSDQFEQMHRNDPQILGRAR